MIALLSWVFEGPFKESFGGYWPIGLGRAYIGAISGYPRWSQDLTGTT